MFVWWCFAVNCTIMQKSGAGLHTANSCYWDTNTDGERWFLQYILPQSVAFQVSKRILLLLLVCSVILLLLHLLTAIAFLKIICTCLFDVWNNLLSGSCTVRWENRTMYCVVSVFAVAVAVWRQMLSCSLNIILCELAPKKILCEILVFFMYTRLTPSHRHGQRK